MSTPFQLSTQFTSFSHPGDNVLFDGGASSDSVTFARQLATIKNIQGDDAPFMVMDIGRVEDLLNQWSKHLPRVQPFYSVQCNSNEMLLKLLSASPLIGGFQCNTHAGMDTALEYMPADKILYTNPCWTRASLNHARSQSVQSLTFENNAQLDRILLNHPNAELILQLCLNPDSEDPNAQMGCELDKASELLQYAADMRANCVGVSFNLGDGVTRPALYGSAIECARGVFEVGVKLGLPFHALNIGGGFSSLNDSLFQEICGQINDSLNYFFPRDVFPGLKVIATPGRFFAESAFTLVTNIVGKRSVDASIITNDDFDSGNEAFIYQTNEGYYGAFGCRIQNNCEPEGLPLFENPMEDDFPSEHALGSIVGPTLDEFDVVQSLCRFRRLSVGDWLIWRNMGAYSLNNRGSLEDGDEEERASSPAIFHFNDRRQQNWNPNSNDGQKININVVLTSDDDGMGSCDETLSFNGSPSSIVLEGEAILGQDDDDEIEAEKNLWILGWLLQEHN